ncbi:hypothetical protein Slin15195_G051030 [Septoria linicola]|uniref:Uncharacterized protein n=1 Tax=Septoria linicola TaxID=215465 RepID=A0A9Q9AM14_9PEZI|nr:hypothetical protein Slin14017_G129610 [Septoria linicola]USW51784.1 hypothetical protein Slin15195_G051030 [Septoria linicola]
MSSHGGLGAQNCSNSWQPPERYRNGEDVAHAHPNWPVAIDTGCLLEEEPATDATWRTSLRPWDELEGAQLANMA